MKKKVMLFALLLLTVSAFSTGNKEEWVSVGGEISRATENSTIYGTDVKTTLNSFGSFFKSYEFAPNENTGIFSHNSFLLPTGGEIESMGTSLDYSYSDTDFISLLGMMLGPAYKKNISNTSNVYLGLGPSVQMLTTTENSDCMMSLMFGLGVDVGVNICATDKFFMNLGVLVDHSFLCYTNLNGTGDWDADYSLTSIRPYVGAGLVL